ncbi:MAG TPA: hypothetical protein VGQ62_07705 [Chloroflexota bacterium]|jgi:hypothetical protein|nr:hypothetical protein [Chloroflexota bacterium]
MTFSGKVQLCLLTQRRPLWSQAGLLSAKLQSLLSAGFGDEVTLAVLSLAASVVYKGCRRH